MQKMIYEPLFELEKTGIHIAYHTKKGRYSPPHWHSAIELIYVLNGTATITIEGKDHSLVAGEFLVVDSNQIHEAQCARVSMMVVIHYSRAIMKNYMSKIDEYRIHCSRQTLKKEKLDKYLEICGLLKRLPPLYVTASGLPSAEPGCGYGGAFCTGEPFLCCGGFCRSGER